MPGTLSPQPKTGPDHLVLTTLGLALLAIGIFAFSQLDRQRRQPAPVNTSSTPSILASVPKSYTEFTGTITAVAPQQFRIHFSGYNDAGKLYGRDYTVRIASTTAFLKLQSGVNGSETVPSTSDQFRVDDTVAVNGDTNLADISDFTATKIIHY